MLDQLLFGQKTAPDFFWDARGGMLPPGASFARASTGWSFNSAGTLASVSTNVARFDYDPATLLPLGYLAEMQSTNNILQSGNVASATWSGTPGVTANFATTPDGTTTATKLTDTASTSGFYRYQNIVYPANAIVPLSMFFKAGSLTNAFITLEGSANNYATAVFDLQAGAVGETKVGSTSGTLVASGIRAVGGGWYRCWIMASVNVTVPFPTFGMTNKATGNTFGTTGEPSYTGTGSGTILMWGGQSETVGSGVTSYIPTAGSAVTRAQDILSIAVTSIPRWNPATGGVLVAKYRLHTNITSSGNGQPVAFVSTDATIPWFEMLAQAGSAAGNTMYDSMRLANGTFPFQVSGGTAVGNFIPRKQAFGWGPSRGQHAYDGGLQMVSTGTFSVPTTMSTLFIGSESTASLNGTIESIAYYAGARSDAFVQQVSR